MRPSRALRSVGVTLNDTRREVEKIIGRGSGALAVEIPFTPRAKRVLEKSWDEARQLSNNFIGTEHLLLGLLRENDCVAMRVLINMDVDVADLRRRTLRLVPDGKAGPIPDEPMVPDEVGDTTEGAYVWYRLDAVTAMKRARVAASCLGHDIVRPGHMLLALLQDSTAINSEKLRSPIDLAKLRTEILASLPPGGAVTGAASMPISPEAQTILHQAWVEAADVKIGLVSADALILALLHESNPEGARLINAAGGNAEELVASIRETVKAEQLAKATTPAGGLPPTDEAPRAERASHMRQSLLLVAAIAAALIALALTSQH